MANKKRSRPNASPAQSDARRVESAEQKPKKKAKFAFSKTLTTDAKLKATVANESKDISEKEQSSVKAVVDGALTEGAKKKKKKKKNKKSENAAATNDADESKEKPKVKSNGIDDLFASLKKEKQKKSIAEEQQKLAEEEEQRQEKKEKERLQQQIKKLEAQNTNSTAAGLNPDPRPVRYDEDGLPIYTEASLQIGKGGTSKDCPFDCWCCF
ncbi:hypothetical protein DVH05_014440 [Phytophthora capsici]|nr:hypothetical protein DVH05_014440 [Phytophthora capsici]